MTKDEIKDEILSHLRDSVDYWDSLPRLTIKSRLNGIVFSMLTMFDGEADFDLMDISIGGITINDGDLHELWDKYK